MTTNQQDLRTVDKTISRPISHNWRVLIVVCYVAVAAVVGMLALSVIQLAQTKKQANEIKEERTRIEADLKKNRSIKNTLAELQKYHERNEWWIRNNYSLNDLLVAIIRSVPEGFAISQIAIENPKRVPTEDDIRIQIEPRLDTVIKFVRIPGQQTSRDIQSFILQLEGEGVFLRNIDTNYIEEEGATLISGQIYFRRDK